MQKYSKDKADTSGIGYLWGWTGQCGCGQRDSALAPRTSGLTVCGDGLSPCLCGSVRGNLWSDPCASICARCWAVWKMLASLRLLQPTAATHEPGTVSDRTPCPTAQSGRLFPDQRTWRIVLTKSCPPGHWFFLFLKTVFKWSLPPT